MSTSSNGNESPRGGSSSNGPASNGAASHLSNAESGNRNAEKDGFPFPHSAFLVPRLDAPPGYPRAPMGEGDEDDSVDLSRYWRALRRRWMLVMATCGAALFLGALWTALQKPVYQSVATLIVSTPGGGGGVVAGVPSFFGGQGVSPSLGQQMLIIRSPSVMKGALGRLSSAQRAQLNDFSRTDLSPEPGADAIDVQVQAHDGALAAHFANILCAQYIAAQNKQNDRQRAERTRDIGAKLKGAKVDLDRASKAVQGFEESHNLADLPAETTTITAQVAGAQAALRDNDDTRAAYERALENVNEQLRVEPDYQPNAIVPTAKSEALKGELTRLGLERTAELREYTLQSRTIRDIDKHIADLNAQLKATSPTQFGPLAPNPIRQGLLGQRSSLKNQIAASLSRSGSLQNDVRDAKAAKSLLPGRAYNLSRLTDNQTLARGLVNTLQQELLSLNVQEIGRGAVASVIEPAETPSAPISPRKGFNLVVSGLLGLLLGSALALLLDRLDDRVYAGEDAELAAHLPILAHIPLVARGAALLAGHTAGSGAHPSGALVESFRMLRANIAFAGLDEPPRSLAITSCRQGEGKSTCALNLATVVALAGKSVLLIDCDLRRPGIHTLLGLPNEAGLTTVAAGRTPLESAIQNTLIPGLRVLTSGPIPSNAPELFESRGGRSALAAAMRSAEFVVMDCPPALGLADAHAIAALCDATLLVVSCDGTTKRGVARAGRSLTGAGARLLGLVINKTPARRGEGDLYLQGQTLESASDGQGSFSFDRVAPTLSGTSQAQGEEANLPEDSRGRH